MRKISKDFLQGNDLLHIFISVWFHIQQNLKYAILQRLKTFKGNPEPTRILTCVIKYIWILIKSFYLNWYIYLILSFITISLSQTHVHTHLYISKYLHLILTFLMQMIMCHKFRYTNRGSLNLQVSKWKNRAHHLLMGRLYTLNNVCSLLLTVEIKTILKFSWPKDHRKWETLIKTG